MRSPTIRTALLSALVTAPLWAGCNKDTVYRPEPTGTVTISFANAVSGSPLQLNQMIYTTPGGTAYSVSKLQYVVSDVTLRSSDGETYGMDGIHFRDETKPDTRSMTLSGVPKGTYDELSFTFGLDEVKNVKNKYLNEPDNFQSAMEWPAAMGGDMGLGYHYMKIEGNFEQTPGGSTTGYTTHMGARYLAAGNPMTGEEDPYPYHHYFRVDLPLSSIETNGNDVNLVVTMNVNGWYQDPTPDDAFDSSYDFRDLSSQMIMANNTAQEKLKANGPACFTVTVSP